MVRFLVHHTLGPPSWFRLLGMLWLLFSAVVWEMNLLLWLNSLNPALGKEPAIDLLYGLKPKVEVFSTFFEICNAQIHQRLTTLAFLVANRSTRSRRWSRCRTGPASFRTTTE